MNEIGSIAFVVNLYALATSHFEVLTARCGTLRMPRITLLLLSVLDGGRGGGRSGDGEDGKCDGAEVCAGWIGLEKGDEGRCAGEYVS